MATIIFKKEDFTKSNEKEYQLEYEINEIGQGSDLIVERLNEKGDYEIVQAPLRRLDNKIFIIWDIPFDGRIMFGL